MGEGRGQPCQKSWILRLRGTETVDEARQLIGLTLIVREEDRPQLEEGELHTRDLVGMRLILKELNLGFFNAVSYVPRFQETSEPVVNVVNVFNSGISGLLQSMLDTSVDILDSTRKPRPTGSRLYGHLVWILFVEEIVANVNVHRKEMLSTHPKGLLELNIRFDERSKKERRQLVTQAVLFFTT